MGPALVGAGIWLAATLHADPRPFVQDPSTPALFPHPADNGFPSDHAAAGGLLAALASRHKPVLGALATVGTVLIAAARVAAHVHHVQDVVAGLTIGAATGVLAVWIVDRTLAVRNSAQELHSSEQGAVRRELARRSGVALLSPELSFRRLRGGLRVTDEALGRGTPRDPALDPTGGPAGNARPTAWIGLTLLVLITAERVTLTDVRGPIDLARHRGSPPRPGGLVKTGSTRWRVLRY